MTSGTSGWLQRLALDSPSKRAWATYDWANSAFWVIVITAVFPPYYAHVADELGADRAQANFAWGTAIALAVIAVAAPLLGTLADYRAMKKKLLVFFAFLGAVASGALFFVQPGDWMLALILFGVANIGASGSVVFYDALLPHVAKRDEVDRLSTSGFALGYVGGGLLLGLSILWIKFPGLFGLPTGEGLSASESTLPVRLSFLAVGVWWFLFTLPLLLRVGEPPRDPSAEPASGQRSLLGIAFRRLGTTFHELRRYRQAFLFLLAFLVYNDGILTIIRMATLYATSHELSQGVVIGTILGIQFAAVPFAFLFGQLASRFGAKRLIFAGLAVYALITVRAFFIKTDVDFIVLGLLVATVQGGTQALSRSVFASLIPARKSGEFFAFFSIGEKFAGVLGPSLYALIIGLTDSSRIAILSILFFFVAGALLLTRVDIEEGRRTARAMDEAGQSTKKGLDQAAPPSSCTTRT